MVQLGPVQIDTGYGLMTIIGFAIWICVPVINSVFEVAVMSSTATIPIIEITRPLYVIIGGGLASIGILGYLGHRTGWW